MVRHLKVLKSLEGKRARKNDATGKRPEYAVIAADVGTGEELPLLVEAAIGTRAALKKLDGVREADASYENSSAWAQYDPARITPEQMIAAIKELGYTATVVRT